MYVFVWFLLFFLVLRFETFVRVICCYIGGHRFFLLVHLVEFAGFVACIACLIFI